MMTRLFHPNRPLLWIVLGSLILRLGYMAFMTAPEQLQYWEYGVLAEHLLEGNGYAFYYTGDDGNVQYAFDANRSPFPSALMPPGYVLFLTPFFLIEDAFWKGILVLLVQNIAGLLLIVMIYRLTAMLCNRQSALVAAVIAGFLPEFIYAHNTIGPTALYHLLTITLLYRLVRKEMYPETGYWHMAGDIALFGAMIYMRSEALLFLGLVLLFRLYRGDYKTLLVTGFCVLMLLLPWQIRNYAVFDSPVTITTNMGLNLYRGHNPDGPGSWGEHDRILSEAARETKSYTFETTANQRFRAEAIQHIKARDFPGHIALAGRKFMHLWLYNPLDRRSHHPLYLVPWIGLLLLFIPGLYMAAGKAGASFPLLFLLHLTLVALVFFAIPRYQTIMKTAILPFSGYAASWLYNLYQDRKRKQGY